MKVRTLTQSLCDRLEEGKITIRQAAEELCKAGHFNYVPTANQTKSYLRKCEGEGRMLEVISTRDLFWNNLMLSLDAEKRESDYLTRGYEYAPHQYRAVKDLEITRTGECRKYSDDGTTYEVIPYTDIDETTLIIWNQFIQKRMWSVPGVTLEKVFRV